MSVPWWLPPAGLAPKDELRHLEHNLAVANGVVMGLRRASGAASRRRKLRQLLVDAAYERDVIGARLDTLREALNPKDGQR